MTHKNEPLTPEGRRRLVERCWTGPIAHVAAEMGISRACARKWVGRYGQFGDLGHLDRSSAPHRQGITISRRTVSRHLAHLGLNQRRFIDPNGESNRDARKIVARHPGHMVHVDVKKVGRIPDGGGWRVHGKGSTQAKAVERGKTAGKKGGYVYLHSAIDGYTRLAYTESLLDEKASTAVGFMHRARAFFAAHGITHIQRIVTDNGSCYRAHDFAKVLHGARHQRITPYTPRHNGKVERYNRILAEEFRYAREWQSEYQRSEALGVWNVHYNYHRPHSAAGDLPPASKLHAGVTNVVASYA
ncbi:integrase core domain-containing protein [Rhodococcus sp. NPDC059234]|uniref:integrase core domain-containing protein n=1 Tax=Rhodococcus sp. NPDC059234 TaxID=3346781 RepID=UPI00366F33BE